MDIFTIAGSSLAGLLVLILVSRTLLWINVNSQITRGTDVLPRWIRKSKGRCDKSRGWTNREIEEFMREKLRDTGYLSSDDGKGRTGIVPGGSNR